MCAGQTDPAAAGVPAAESAVPGRRIRGAARGRGARMGEDEAQRGGETSKHKGGCWIMMEGAVHYYSALKKCSWNPVR
jgi:hypothetical protein